MGSPQNKTARERAPPDTRLSFYNLISQGTTPSLDPGFTSHPHSVGQGYSRTGTGELGSGGPSWRPPATVSGDSRLGRGRKVSSP